MAKRPVFIPRVSGRQFVEENLIEFTWIPGMAASQKRKNVISLHQAAHRKGIDPVLEISTKSQLALGEALSAFNLKLEVPGVGRISVEAAFQGSKVFQNGGPYQEYYSMSPREIRQDERLRNSGNLVAFDLAGDIWGLNPLTAFYDWLYLSALCQNPDVSGQLVGFDGFTDIEFNPEKSLNCQARSAALYVSLSHGGLLEKAMRGKADYLLVIQSKPGDTLASLQDSQPKLF